MRLFLSAAIRVLACLVIALIVAEERQRAAYGQSDNAVVAVVNGRNIIQREVDDAIISQLFPLELQIYSFRKAALENLISRVILEGEAKKRGLSIEELRGQLTAGKVEISKNQVEQVYVENAAVFASMSSDEAKERLRLDLESQARMKNYREALTRLRETSNIEFRLDEPRLPISNSSDVAFSKGSTEAAITIVEFSDFQCPYCKTSQEVIKQVVQTFGKEVRLVFKHLPLEIHSQAFPAAQAAYCAGRQGFFWQYHDALFASGTFSPAVFKNLAADLGLDRPRFQDCVTSEISRAAVLKDMNEAKRFGINSTPTFIINGRLFPGAHSFEDFKAALERELKFAQSGSRKQ